MTHAHELSSLTARLSNAKISTGLAHRGDSFLDFPLRTPKYCDMDKHASSYGLQLLEFLGIPPVAHLFPISGQDLDRGRKLAMGGSTCRASGSESRPVVIHPGAGDQNKVWPKENFIFIIRELISRERTVVLVGGKIETPTCASIEQAIKNSNALRNLSGRLNIGELCGAISAAEVFIGHDSGPSHIAGALGVKSCVLFGPSNPAIWAPRGSNVKVLHFKTGQFKTPDSVSAVLATVEKLLVREPREDSALAREVLST